MNSPAPAEFARPPARWVILATCALVIVPNVVLEWEREPARWRAAAAQNLLEDGHYDAAVQELDQALQRYPASNSTLAQRVQTRLLWARQDRPWRRAADEPPITSEQRSTLLQAALEDVRELISRNPHIQYLELCSQILLEMGDGAGAVAQVKRIEKRPSRLAPDELLNLGAYIRACARIELPAALEKVDEALGYHPTVSSPRTMYLDTRGFIRHLLGQNEEALDDMNEAVEAFRKREYANWDREKYLKQLNDVRVVDRVDLQARESMATFLYHRMIVLRALGEDEAAAEDLEEIENLLPGYDGRELR